MYNTHCHMFSPKTKTHKIYPDKIMSLTVETTDCLITQISGGGNVQDNRDSDETITSNTTVPLISFYVQCGYIFN